MDRSVVSIPTYDADPSVTHPDVVHVPGGWNGYAYWMAFTPYPAAVRENPSIAASTDGISWEVPSGLTNPIASLSDANSEGLSYWSDTDLLLVDGELWCYFRGAESTNPESIWRMTSGDGVTWTAREKVLEGTGTSILSPAVVQEEDGTFTMWAVDFGSNTIERWSSPDGATWIAGTTCTVPSGVDLWHLDVARHSSSYYAALVNNQENLWFWTSSDGVTWSGSSVPAFRLTHDEFTGNYYRSCLVERPDGRWKVYVATRQGADTDPPWQIGLLDGVRFAAAQ